MKFINYNILFFWILLLSLSVSAFSLSDQGAGVRFKESGELVQNGNLTIHIFDTMINGPALHSFEFIGVINNGFWNVMLGSSENPLLLEYGRPYFKEYSINGETVSFRNSAGNVVPRQLFYSPIGNISGSFLQNETVPLSSLVTCAEDELIIVKNNTWNCLSNTFLSVFNGTVHQNLFFENHTLSAELFIGNGSLLTDISYVVTLEDVLQYKDFFEINESQISDLQNYILLSDFESHPVFIISSEMISNWNEAYAFGNHSQMGYIISDDLVEYYNITQINSLPLSHFVDDLGNRGYTSLSNFTNDVGFLTDYLVTEGDVIQHQSALVLNASQISDLNEYVSSQDTLQNITDRGAVTDNTITSTNSNPINVESTDTIIDFISNNGGRVLRINTPINSNGENLFIGLAGPTNGLQNLASPGPQSSRNVVIGRTTGGSLTTGFYNTFVGWGSGNQLTTGAVNAFIGYQAGRDVTTGSNNVAIGRDSFGNTVGGQNNIGIGTFAIRNAVGNENIGIGSSSGLGVTSSMRGVFIGASAGRYNSTGDQLNTVTDSFFLGTNTRALHSTSTNEMVIGTNAIGKGDNTITIGSPITNAVYFDSDTLIDGDVEITGTLNVEDDLIVDGTITANAFIGDGSQLTGITADVAEVDTLQSVTDRGSTTDNAITVDGLTISDSVVTTQKLTVNARSRFNERIDYYNTGLWFFDPDINTPFNPSNLYFRISRYNSLAGGAVHQGWNTGNRQGLAFQGHVGTNSPTAPAMTIEGFKWSGSGTARTDMVGDDKIVNFIGGQTLSNTAALITANGKLGLNIGNTVPSANLHVGGDALIEDDIEIQGNIQIDGNIMHNNNHGISGNFSVGDCWMAFSGGLLYATNCSEE